MSVLIGNRNGQMGLWVGQPGQDVFSANEYDMLFSSNFASMRLIQAGTIIIPGNSGNQDSGSTEFVANVGFDKDYSTSALPVVAAVARCSNWTFHLIARKSDGSVLGVGTFTQSITTSGFLTETYIFPKTLLAGGNIFVDGASRNFIPGTGWGPVKFRVRVYGSFCQFARSINDGEFTIKYLFFDPNN